MWHLKDGTGWSRTRGERRSHGEKTLRFLDKLDEVTRQVGGRVNPSKDARMCPEDFQRNFKHWENMKAYVDPNFSSSFWRRVTTQS